MMMIRVQWKAASGLAEVIPFNSNDHSQHEADHDDHDDDLAYHDDDLAYLDDDLADHDDDLDHDDEDKVSMESWASCLRTGGGIRMNFKNSATFRIIHFPEIVIIMIRMILMMILIIMTMKIISNFLKHSLSGDHYQEDYQDGYYDDLDDPDDDLIIMIVRIKIINSPAIIMMKIILMIRIKSMIVMMI